MNSSNNLLLKVEARGNSTAHKLIEILSGLTCLGLLLIFATYLIQFRHVALSCVRLSGIETSYINQTTGGVKCNESMAGAALIVKGRQFRDGFGVHSFSTLQFKIPHSTYFHSFVGLPDTLIGTAASVGFEVLGDGKLLWQSPVIHPGELFEVKVDTANVTNLELRVTDGGDGNYWDHACWLEPRLVFTAS